MQKYIYTVSRIANYDDERQVVSIVNSCIDAEEVQASSVDSRICIRVKDGTDKNEMEMKLSYALQKAGYELILPEGAMTFIPVTDKPEKKVRRVSLGTAVILAVAVGLFCIMTTFGICTRYMTQKQSDTPEYIDDLVRLDEFFRTYSYDGITDEDFGKHIIDAYIAYSGDPYAVYYTEEELEALEKDLTGEFVGIGVGIVEGEIIIDGQKMTAIQIMSVYDDSSAQEANILVGDMITHIGIGENAKSVAEIGYSAALDMLAGEEGSFVEFTLYTRSADGEYEKRELKIERRKVLGVYVKGVSYTTDSTIGVITINRFDYKTPAQFCDVVDSLSAQGCKYFVIDLRNNPGGYVESVVSVLSYFLDEGDLIMTVEDRDGKVVEKQTAQARKNDYFSITKEDVGKYKGMKMCVLVNKNTASAAELFAATARDYSLGTIVGVTTFGKGCMQRTYMLDSYGMKGALKITTNMYFSKSHTPYHGTGIEPDVTVELSEEAKTYPANLIPHDKDNQLQEAIKNLK